MKAVRERVQKVIPQGVGKPVLVALVLGVGALIFLAVSGISNSSSPPHESQRLLAENGQLHLCQVELERVKAGKGFDQCEDTLRRTQASLAAALGVPLRGGASETVASSTTDSVSGATQCPPCPATPAAAAANCPAVVCPACTGQGGGAVLPSNVDSLSWRDADTMDMAGLKAEIGDLRDMAKRLIAEKVRLESQLKGSASWDAKAISSEAMESARKLLGDCNVPVAPASSGGSGENITMWKGYQCKASDAELQRYLNYTPRAVCPQDWYFTQKLIYMKDCFALPRRRCLSITPPEPGEPLPFPGSLFNQAALKDSNVRWDLHQCKSFECLNSRKIGDCRNCFNLELEERRWKSQYRGSIKMADVIKLKNGSLRLGLDAGGGTGSFAAHMALYNVTVMTTAFNVETVPGRKGGLPYMEAIALRGLIPLHVPHKARLPLYDGTLDVIHSVNSIKYLPPLEFEELLLEWDRVLRAGGVLWFEMFYAPVSEMPVYVNLVEMLGYKKLYWNYTPKPDAGEKEGEHVYLNCVIEKPARPGTEVLDGPPEIDTIDMI